MTHDDALDHEIRRALRAEADLIEVPEHLAELTLEEARDEEPALAARLRARWDAYRSRPRGVPRVAWVGAGALVLAALFATGTVIQPSQGDRTANRPAERTALTAAGGEADLGAEETSGSVSQAEQPTSSGVAQDEETRSSDPIAGGQITGAIADNATVQDSNESVGSTATAGAAVAANVETSPQRGNNRAAVSQSAETQVPTSEAFPPQLVQEADLELEVPTGGFNDAWGKAQRIASAHDGFVTSSSTEQTDGERASGSITIRVPAEKLEAALNAFRDLGEVVELRTTADDVSGQIVDLDARIASAKAEEAQLLELLTETEGVSEVLEVRTRLDSVRTQVEQLTAQRDLIQNRVAMATLRTTILEPEAAAARDDAAPGRFEQAWDQALAVAETIAAGTVVAMGVVLPAAALGLLAFGFVALLRRRSA